MTARTELLATARRAALSLQRSIADKPPETPIETNVQSLNGLAAVIDGLVVDADQCGGVDCMGRVSDGVKLWVTRARLDAAEERVARYETMLRTIADLGQGDLGALGMLMDWESTAKSMAEIARSGLDA